MAAMWTVGGLIEPHIPHASHPLNAVAVSQMLLFGVLSFAWCKAHARARGIQPPMAAPLLTGLCPPLGMPYYSLRAFGLGRGTLLVVIGIALLLVFMVLYGVSYFLSASVGT